MNNLNIVFFGTPDFAVMVLDQLLKQGLTIDTIVTQPDKPAGRKMILTPPPVKEWAINHTISCLQPQTLSDDSWMTQMHGNTYDLFIVAAYGLIIPQSVLDLPKYGTINIHPSLLPRHRGASPLHQAILDDDETGVSIMLMDDKMDHGPILAIDKTRTSQWPIEIAELKKLTAVQGADMIVELLPSVVAHTVESKEQNHEEATFTKKVQKKDGEIDLNASAEENYRKFCAYHEWPRIFFYTKNKSGKSIRVIITQASLQNGKFVIEKVLPEGKKEMPHTIFLDSIRQS